MEAHLHGTKGASLSLSVTLTYQVKVVRTVKAATKGKPHITSKVVKAATKGKPRITSKARTAKTTYVARRVVLYHHAVRLNRHGQATVPFTLTYNPAKAMTVTLAVQAGTVCGGTMRVTVTPTRHTTTPHPHKR